MIKDQYLKFKVDIKEKKKMYKKKLRKGFIIRVIFIFSNENFILQFMIQKR